MLIYLLNEEHLNLVSCEVTWVVMRMLSVLGRLLPELARLSTFAIALHRNHQGPQSDKNDTVTFKTPSSCFWCPTQSDTVADNGTWPGNCKFKIAAEAGATNSA